MKKLQKMKLYRKAGYYIASCAVNNK